MPDIPVVAIIALGAVVAVILYVLLWRATTARSVGAKLLARVALPIFIVIPALLLAALSYHSADLTGAAPPSASSPAPENYRSAPAEPTDECDQSDRGREGQRGSDAPLRDAARRGRGRDEAGRSGAARRRTCPAPLRRADAPAAPDGPASEPHAYAPKKAKPNGGSEPPEAVDQESPATVDESRAWGR